MKRMIGLGAVVLTASMMLTSCYTYTTVVGKGAQGNSETKKMEPLCTVRACACRGI